MTSTLSLYRIETELLELMRLREETAQNPDATPQEAAAEMQAIDKQITEYVHREVAKVDGIAAYLRECETRAAVLKAEAKRIAAQADAWTERGEHLEEVTLRVMQMIGATQLDGTTSTFKVRKNPPSVEVVQPELLPDTHQRVTVTMTGEMYRRIIRCVLEGCYSDLFDDLKGCKTGDFEPLKGTIARDLKAGIGVPGCTLVTDKVRLVVE
jgi:Siphovirus Gp157